jgi:hypothetical protein
MSAEQSCDSRQTCVPADLQFAIDSMKRALPLCTDERRAYHYKDIRKIARGIDRELLKAELKNDHA